MNERNATMVVRVVASTGNTTSPVPATMVSRATRNLARRLSPASSARSRATRRRWMESSTRMLLSSRSPKQTVSPLMVMKFTDSLKK